MSYSISTLLKRNLQDVFGEGDPERRRAAIDEIYTDDVVFYDPSKGVYRGRDEIDRIAMRPQGDSSRLHLSANYRARGIGQWRAGPMGIRPPWRRASIRRNGFHHRPGRPDCRHLSLLRQAALSWARVEPLPMITMSYSSVDAFLAMRDCR